MERKELESESIGTWDGDIAEYTDYHQYYPKEEADSVMDEIEAENRKLRYERLMNKAKNLHTYGLLLTEQAEASNTSMTTRSKHFKAMRCHRIAEALKTRARKLKEEK